MKQYILLTVCVCIYAWKREWESTEMKNSGSYLESASIPNQKYIDHNRSRHSPREKEREKGGEQDFARECQNSKYTLRSQLKFEIIFGCSVVSFYRHHQNPSNSWHQWYITIKTIWIQVTSTTKHHFNFGANKMLSLLLGSNVFEKTQKRKPKRTTTTSNKVHKLDEKMSASLGVRQNTLIVMIVSLWCLSLFAFFDTIKSPYTSSFKLTNHVI